MKQLFLSAVTFLLMLFLLFCFVLSATAIQDKRILIGTASKGGIYYPLGSAISEVINKYCSGFKALPEVSTGLSENIKKLGEGNIEMGISYSDMSYFAYNGMERYKNSPIVSLRSLFALGEFQPFQIFTLVDSDIKTIHDFRGKHIGMGLQGSTGETEGKKVLEFYDLDYESIQPVFISNNEAVKAFKDGTIDAFMHRGPLHSSFLIELTNAIKVRMIPVNVPDEFFKKYPYYIAQVIPKKTYKNINYDVQTTAVRMNMLTSIKLGLTKDDIYQILQIIWKHEKKWTSAHTAFKNKISFKDAILGLGVPLHPGAVKFYKEKGFSIPENLLP
ncbi:MAG: TAXI family TRAP transporter solute-binding subunit [Actinomycetia bacterium]|nr:TAXI family TRAP transporter solute-binding subunit [Actinomycetes bacterium]